MKLHTITLCCLLSLNSFTAFSAAPAKLDRENNFDLGWRFLKADAPGAEDAAFNDSAWRTVDLPHDWSIEDLPQATANPPSPVTSPTNSATGRGRGRGRANFPVVGPFSPESPGGTATGYTLGGTGWYRKHFTLDKQTLGKRVTIEFDGVYMDSDVWLNGHHLGNHPYGYTAFAYDLTEFLNPPGQENVLAVRVRNTGQEQPLVFRLRHLPPRRSGSDRSAARRPMGRLCHDSAGHEAEGRRQRGNHNHQRAKRGHSLHAANQTAGSERKNFADRRNECSGKRRRPIGNPAGLRDQIAAALVHRITRSSARRTWNFWSAAKVVDASTTTFGIREIKFSVENGFTLNGVPVKLRGGCLHHDNGPLGSEAIDRAEERRVELMKASGYNAIRTSHNPPSTAFLDACDRLGMLVLDEAFDCWEAGKNPDDYSKYFDDWWQRDLDSMILRDRNHPCVILWSIGNEIPTSAPTTATSSPKS